MNVSEGNSPQTVLEFAKELGQPPESVLAQFCVAGVAKESTADIVSLLDREKLLSWLKQNPRYAAQPRKRITLIPTPDWVLGKDVANGVNGAEWELLENFAFQVSLGKVVQPKEQRLVNLIIAKSIISGALPPKPRGRPKDEDSDTLSLRVAMDYWEMRDAGVPYAIAVKNLSEQIHKDERHVMRLVKKHKSYVGETLDKRKLRREWHRVCAYMYSDEAGSPWRMVSFSGSDDVELRDLSEEDLLARLNKMISTEFIDLNLLTKKS